MKTFCSSKDIMEWEENIWESNIWKGLVSTVYWKFLQINNSKNLNPRWATDQNWLFSKDILMAIKHMKKCPTLFAIREVQIKTYKTQNDAYPPGWLL